MLIPLGFWAASAGGGAAGSFDLLETQVLASSAASVTFSSLSTYAADYQHLQIRLTARFTNISGAEAVRVQFNADTGNNYARHTLFANGSSVGSFGGANQDRFELGDYPWNSSTANAFGGAVIDILDPFETTKYTTARALTGSEHGSGNRLQFVSGLWMNTNALSEIRLYSAFSTMLTGSRFSLYGIRGG
jgi:hypothetical protein